MPASTLIASLTISQVEEYLNEFNLANDKSQYLSKVISNKNVHVSVKYCLLKYAKNTMPIVENAYQLLNLIKPNNLFFSQIERMSLDYSE